MSPYDRVLVLTACSVHTEIFIKLDQIAKEHTEPHSKLIAQYHARKCKRTGSTEAIHPYLHGIEGKSSLYMRVVSLRINAQVNDMLGEIMNGRRILQGVSRCESFTHRVAVPAATQSIDVKACFGHWLLRLVPFLLEPAHNHLSYRQPR